MLNLVGLLLPLFAGVRQSARRTARRAAFGTIAAASALVALGFFSAAGYILLAPHWGPAGAAAAIGGLYLLVAVVAALLAANAKAPEPEPVPRGQAWIGLAEALLVGISAGRGMKR